MRNPWGKLNKSDKKKVNQLARTGMYGGKPKGLRKIK